MNRLHTLNNTTKYVLDSLQLHYDSIILNAQPNMSSSAGKILFGAYR